jgi:hypothetical protein
MEWHLAHLWAANTLFPAANGPESVPGAAGAVTAVGAVALVSVFAPLAR